MSNQESLGQSGGDDWRSGNLANYKPAYPLGNPRDAERIARSSGKPMENFLKVHPVEEICNLAPEVDSELKEA